MFGQVCLCVDVSVLIYVCECICVCRGTCVSGYVYVCVRVLTEVSFFFWRLPRESLFRDTHTCHMQISSQLISSFGVKVDFHNYVMGHASCEQVPHPHLFRHTFIQLRYMAWQGIGRLLNFYVSCQEKRYVWRAPLQMRPANWKDLHFVDAPCCNFFPNNSPIKLCIYAFMIYVYVCTYL